MSDLFSYNAAASAAGTSTLNTALPVRRRFAFVYLCLLLGLLTPISLLAAFNYYTDRSGVFHEDRNFTTVTNLNFVRMEYLLENDTQHSVILFGSSRANALDVRAHISATGYTFSTLRGVVYYYLLNLKALIDSGIVPDTVILGLGEDAIKVAPKPNADQARDFRQHPRTENVHPLLYFWNYLAVIPTETDFLLFKEQLRTSLKGGRTRGGRSLDVLHTGRFYCYTCENRARQRSDEEHIAALATDMQRLIRIFRIRDTTVNESDYGVSEAIETIKSIVDLADSNGISLFIFIDPIYQDNYLKEDVPRLIAFKRELSQVSPFLDFSNFNSAFANARNFIDPIHYNLETGARLMDEISSALAGNVGDVEMGSWVTAKNVDAYLQQQQAIYLSLQQQGQDAFRDTND